MKGTIQEADRGRELLIRELQQSKELEYDRVKEVEERKQAEVEVLQRIIEAMKRDKEEIKQSY